MKSKFDRAISGAKKMGDWAISEDNPVGRGSKKVSEMAEEKATEYDKQGKRIKADLLRVADAIRDSVTPKTPLDTATMFAGTKAVAKGVESLKEISRLRKTRNELIRLNELKKRNITEKYNKMTGRIKKKLNAHILREPGKTTIIRGGPINAKAIEEKARETLRVKEIRERYRLQKGHHGN